MGNPETHPWKWFLPEGCTKLILGTFPTAKKNRSFEFFYPNVQNLFWKIIAGVAGKTLQHFQGREAVAERKKLLRQLKAGISDMGNVIFRKENSSLDEKLILKEFMDIARVIRENPQIDTIIFTSSSGNVSATKWFEQYLQSQNIFFRFSKGQKPVKDHIVFQQKIFFLIVLHSPSPRVSNRIGFHQLVEMYRKALIS